MANNNIKGTIHAEALTVKEAAKMLNLSPATMYQLVRQPDFPAVRLGPRTTRIPVEALRRWMAERAEE